MNKWKFGHYETITLNNSDWLVSILLLILAFLNANTLPI